MHSNARDKSPSDTRTANIRIPSFKLKNPSQNILNKGTTCEDKFIAEQKLLKKFRKKINSSINKLRIDWRFERECNNIILILLGK